jgi:hypothetical protein
MEIMRKSHQNGHVIEKKSPVGVPGFAPEAGPEPAPP